MQFTIRTAEASDVETIADLIEEIEKFYGSSSIQPFDERVSQVGEALFGSPPCAVALLAFTPTHDLIGMASYSFLWPAAGSSHSMYLKELYVGEPFRRYGLGHDLMDRLREIATARPGCTRLEWMTDRSNDGARSFYRELGFEEFKEKIVYRWDVERPTNQS